MHPYKNIMLSTLQSLQSIDSEGLVKDYRETYKETKESALASLEKDVTSFLESTDESLITSLKRELNWAKDKILNCFDDQHILKLAIESSSFKANSIKYSKSGATISDTLTNTPLDQYSFLLECHKALFVIGDFYRIKDRILTSDINRKLNKEQKIIFDKFIECENQP
jgi:hypothetical protein